MRVPCFLACLSAFVSSAIAAEHPFLLFPASMEVAVKEKISSDPLAGEIQKTIVARAEKSLAERTCEYRIPDGLRLLGESRRAQDVIFHCAWAWRTTGEEKFRTRAIREMDAACALKDWNPKHFLDVGEMSAAVSIGYDWLYPSLTVEQRKRYEDTLVSHALAVVGKAHGKTGWWLGATNNWSQVCNSGIGLAAMAVRGRNPGLFDPLLSHCRDVIGKCVSFYQPDGCYPEGPAYWHYGTNYDVMFRAACETTGEPMEFPAVMKQSGDFLLHVYGPTGDSYNFADSHPSREAPTPAQCWIASQAQDNAQSAAVRERIAKALSRRGRENFGSDLRFFPLHLLWLPAQPREICAPPLSAFFRGKQAMAFFRTGWKPDAAWLAIKGGTGAASHGHLDAGSFVYEAAGVRWFHDLGSDDYNMPGYFGKQRWNYLRMTNFSHNTLVIDGKLQALPKEGCPIISKHSGGHIAQVAFDLTPAYGDHAGKIIRKAAFNMASGEVLLQDAITQVAGPVRWAAITKASIRIEGTRVVLEENGKKLVIERRDENGGPWEEFSLTPKTARENKNTGFHMIGFTVPADRAREIKITWKLL